MVTKESCPWCMKEGIRIARTKLAVKKMCLDKRCGYYSWAAKSMLNEQEKVQLGVTKKRSKRKQRKAERGKLLQEPQASSIVLHGVKQYIATRPLPIKVKPISFLKDV